MHTIKVSIVFATRDRQILIEKEIARGASVAELIELSGIRQQFSELNEAKIEALSLGVFSQKVQPDYMLQNGDRVEIYRQLKADPKEVRRQLALIGKTMGKGKTGRKSQL